MQSNLCLVYTAGQCATWASTRNATNLLARSLRAQVFYLMLFSHAAQNLFTALPKKSVLQIKKNAGFTLIFRKMYTCIIYGAYGMGVPSFERLACRLVFLICFFSLGLVSVERFFLAARREKVEKRQSGYEFNLFHCSLLLLPLLQRK
jgi:hypothetical protein